MSTVTEVDYDIWSECDVEVFENRDQWLEARTSMFGASEAASLLGCGYSDQNAHTVIASKIARQLDESEAKRLMIGRIMEPALRELFELETGLKCLPQPQYSIVRNHELPWLGASLDGATCDPDRGMCPIELKHVDGFNLWQWRDGSGPLKFQVQCQHQMAVTGATRAYLFGVVGSGNLVSIVVERNQRFIEAMLASLRKFWGFVERRELPPVDGSEATTRALRILHPDDSGATVTLPSDADTWTSQIETADLEIDVAVARRDELKNKLREAIGESSYGLLGDGSRWSWKTTEKKGYYVKPQKTRVLRKVGPEKHHT
jgi:putative phage-type endonuclease